MFHKFHKSECFETSTTLSISLPEFAVLGGPTVQNPMHAEVRILQILGTTDVVGDDAEGSLSVDVGGNGEHEGAHEDNLSRIQQIFSNVCRSLHLKCKETHDRLSLCKQRDMNIKISFRKHKEMM